MDCHKFRYVISKIREIDSEPLLTDGMRLLSAKIINGIRLLTTAAESSVMDGGLVMQETWIQL